MKHKVAELEGALLDAAVALAEGRLVTEADEHPSQPGYYRKTRDEWGCHIVRWYAREGENADGPETDEEGGWEAITSWGSPSNDWAHGGPMIERERIALNAVSHDPRGWAAGIWDDSERISHGVRVRPGYRGSEVYGNTPLIAAMRAYVSSKLGDEVELP